MAVRKAREQVADEKLFNFLGCEFEIVTWNENWYV